MNKGVLKNRVWIPLGAALMTCLSGCSELDVLDPKGSIGVAEKSLIGTATYTMLIVVVPVILMTLWFAWRYRANNRRATYAPKWAHSTAIEVVIWTVPSIIILCLGVLTWRTTHELDPYRPIESAVKPINVEVRAVRFSHSHERTYAIVQSSSRAGAAQRRYSERSQRVGSSMRWSEGAR